MGDDLRAQATIDRAFLLAASPETVHAWLRERASEGSWFEEGVPEALLVALHARRERLIDLGLAQFSKSRALLKELYSGGDEALRCAVLSNAALGELFLPFWRPPWDRLLTEQEEKALVEGGTLAELEAFLTNRSIYPGVLEALFKRTSPFEQLPESRWIHCLMLASSNASLHAPDDDPSAEGQGLDASKALAAAWSLLDTLPATSDWAARLHILYKRMKFQTPRDVRYPMDVDDDEQRLGLAIERIHAAQLEFVRDVFSKWYAEAPAGPAETSEAKPKNENSAQGEADEDDAADEEDEESERVRLFSELRRTVASRVPLYHDGLKEFLRDHPDRFVRMGYYEQFRPSAKEVDAAYERDGHGFLEGAVENRHFYKKGYRQLGRLLYALVHEQEGDRADDLSRSHRSCGEFWSRKDPRVFEFDELELMRSADRADEKSTFMSTAEQFVDEIAQFVLHKEERDDVVEIAMRLKGSLKELDEEWRKRLADLEVEWRERLNQVRQDQQGMVQLLLWAVGISAVVLLVNLLR